MRRKDRKWQYVFDAWYANDVCDFAEKMPHVEGTWDSDTIELHESQIFMLCCIFGWRKKSDDNRRFNTVYIEMARKGAKSTLSAVVSLYCLTCEGEVGPQIIIGATTGDQANKVFKPAKTMAERTPDYRSEFEVKVWANSISCQDNGGFIQRINAKSSTQDGWNPYVAVLDELHAHKDRGLYDVIKSSFGARRNYMLWIITTAGYNIDGVCYEQRTLVTKILEEIIEVDHYFGIIYTLDEKDNELDPKVWPKANPMLGITPSMESMIDYSKEAAAAPGSMGEFKTKRLNVWTNAKGGWLNMELWKKCTGRFSLKALENVPCYAGLDLASVSDIAAFVLVWEAKGFYLIKGHYYLPEDVIWPRTEKANVPYALWVEQGWLTPTPGNVTDYEFIEADIISCMDRFTIKRIAYDPWNAYDLTNRLQNQGAPMVEFRQGPKSFNPPMTELERHLKAKKIKYNCDPVLTWMASNIVARKDVNQNKAPDKKNSTEKIDGIVAALMGIGSMAEPDENKKSVYEERGIRRL